MDREAALSQTQFSVSIRFGVAMSCVPQARDDSSPTPGSRMSRYLRVACSGGARVRETGGVASKKVDRQPVEEYLREMDLPQAIAGVRDEAAEGSVGMRGQYLLGLSLSLETMWDLAMEVLGKGQARSICSER